MNAETMSVVYGALNELAVKMAKACEWEDISLTLEISKAVVPLKWRQLEAEFALQPELVRRLAQGLFTVDQMARQGFVPLGFKELLSPRGIKRALNIGVVNTEDAMQIVQTIQRILPKKILETLVEVRVYSVRPSDFHRVISSFKRKVQPGDHPLLLSFDRIHSAVKPMLTSGRLTDAEILAWVKNSMREVHQSEFEDYDSEDRK